MLNRAVLYRGIATLWVAVVFTLLTLPPVFAVPTQERDPTALAIAASYVAFFERAPDYDGLGFWTNVAQQSGLNDLELMRDLARGFADHPSFADLYAGMSAGEFVDAIYLNVGGALPDAGGRQFWLNQIQSADLTRPEFVADFVFGLLNLSEPQLDELLAQGDITEAEHAGALLRKNRLTYRAEVGLAFTATLESAANLEAGTNPLDPQSLAVDPVYQAAQKIVSGVSDAVATRNSALAYLADMAANPSIAAINAASLADIFGTTEATGRLHVTLEPAAARDAGAQWRRVGTETWFNSGETETDIPASGQSIEFQNISGWAAPATATVGINAGQTTELVRGYINATEAARLTRPQLVSATSNTRDSASLSWLPAEDTQAPDASITYGVHLSDTAAFTPDITTAYHTVVDSAFAHISGLQPQTRYYVKITAQTANGGVSWSNELSVTTAATDPVFNPQQPATIVTAAETLAIDDASVLVSTPPQPGDILVSEGGVGLFRKVTTVTPEGGAFRVVTEPAAMNELFDELLLSSETQLADLPTTSAASARLRTTRTAEGGELRQAYWPETGFRLTQETQPLSDQVLRRSVSPATRRNGIGELHDIENNKLRITGPVNVAVAPGNRIRIEIDAQLINDPDNDYTLTDLELSSFKPPSWSLFSPTPAPEHTLQLTRDTDRAKSFTLDWTPQQHHVDDRSRPYTAEFRATARKNDCRWWCTHHVTLEVPIYIIWGDLPQGEATRFDSDEQDTGEDSGGHFDGEVNGEIRLSGDARVSFDPTLRVDKSIRRTILGVRTLERAEVLLDGRIRFELDARIAAEGRAKASGSQRLLRKRFVKVFVVGTVPVVMRGDLTLTAHLEALADAAMDIEQNITLGYDVTTGLLYTEADGWDPVKRAEPVYRYNLEGEADAKAHLKIRLEPDLQISFYEAATGRLIIEPYLAGDLALEGQFLYQQGQLWDYNDAAYRFTQLEVAGGVDAKLRADLSFFDVTIAGYPSRDADDFLEIALLDRTTIVGLSELGLQENGGSLTDYPGAVGIQASVHDRGFWDRFHFEPGSAYWEGFPRNSEFYLLPDPSDDPYIVWACALNGGPHTVRFGGHSQLNVFIQQYEEIELDLPECDPQGPLPDDPLPGDTGGDDTVDAFPLREGVYARSVEYCSFEDFDPFDYGDLIGSVRLVFEDNTMHYYESECHVDEAVERNGRVEVRYTCSGEGFTWSDEALFEDVSETTFTRVTEFGRYSYTHCDVLSGTDTGSLQVTITPSAAITAGAQWRRANTNPWFDSGTTETGIPIGGQTVEFKVIPNWIAPSNVTESIRAGQTTTLTRSYEPETIDPVDPVDPPPHTTGRLNDTGIDWCADGNTTFLACPVAAYPGQDGDYGRDALARAGQLQKVGAGAAGFDYTKLDANGNDLPASALNWSCVRDNVTGLIWEVKTNDGGLRDQGNRYTWYNPDPNTNGGHAGTQDGGTCTGSACDTHGYVQAVNAQGLCGVSDWRMPGRQELLSIVHNGQPYAGDMITDRDYFPNTLSSWYWSSSSLAFNNGFSAWPLSTETQGPPGIYSKSTAHYVRLVHSSEVASHNEAETSCVNENTAIPATTPTDAFVVHANGTVTHKRTGLMWMRCSLEQFWDGTTCTDSEVIANRWQDALIATQVFNDTGGFAGYDDWRLPNKNELISIVEERCWDPAINTAVFPVSSSSSYWSSSPSPGGYFVWLVGFHFGSVDVTFTDSELFVSTRLVRTAQ